MREKSLKDRFVYSKELNLAITLVCCGSVLLFADLGLISSYDGVFVALLIALIRPSMAPYLLITVSSIQDAPGMAGAAWYLSFVLVGCVAVVYGVKTASIDRGDLLSVNAWGLGATFVVAFALLISLANDSLGGYPQSSARNPIMVGMLIVFMIWVSIQSTNILRLDQGAQKILIWLAVILLTHGIGVALLQVLIHPMFMASARGAEEMQGLAQLTQVTSLGIPRAHGTFLSPNAFALYVIYLVLIVQVYRKQEPLKVGYVVFWCVFALVICVLSQSKSIVLFYAVSALLMMIQVRSWALIAASVFLSVPTIFWLYHAGVIADLAASFRVYNELSGDSYRSIAWSAVMENFSWYDWITGVGLSHWPVFFEEKVGFTLADPHTWLMSIPGTFGLPGLIFYLCIIIALAVKAVNARGNAKSVATTMLVLLLIKDMFSVQYLLSNTPFTFMVWLILMQLFNNRIRVLKVG